MPLIRNSLSILLKTSKRCCNLNVWLIKKSMIPSCSTLKILHRIRWSGILTFNVSPILHYSMSQFSLKKSWKIDHKKSMWDHFSKTFELSIIRLKFALLAMKWWVVRLTSICHQVSKKLAFLGSWCLLLLRMTLKGAQISNVSI